MLKETDCLVCSVLLPTRSNMIKVVQLKWEKGNGMSVFWGVKCQQILMLQGYGH